jgi:hypothetical protein
VACSHLAPIVAWIVARIPLRVITAGLAALIDRLPPAATLVVFIVPVLLLLPLKFLGLWSRRAATGSVRSACLYSQRCSASASRHSSSI